MDPQSARRAVKNSMEIDGFYFYFYLILVAFCFILFSVWLPFSVAGKKGIFREKAARGTLL